jgi:predicted MFS family arabinose efflux permease
VNDPGRPLQAIPEAAPDAHLRTVSSRKLIQILAVSGFASTFSGRAVEPLVGVMARHFASPAETVALLSAAFALPYAFFQPVLGPVGDALGKERIMKICLVVLCAAALGSTLAPNLPALFATRVAAGAAAGGVVPLALALLADRVGMADRQVAISRFLVSVILGQMAGSSVAGILAGWIGWRGVFAVSTALIALAGAATVASFRHSAPATGFDIGIAARRYRTILSIGRARALFAFVFVEAIAVFGMFPFIAPLLEARGGGGPTQAGLAIGGFAIGGLVYSALVGWMLRNLGLSRMLVAAGAAAALATLAIGLAGDWRLDAAAMVLLGFGFYMLHNSFQTQVTEVLPAARASVVALHAFSFYCGQALGVMLVGFGLRTIGQMSTFACAAVTILAVGGTAAWVLARPFRPAALA